MFTSSRGGHVNLPPSNKKSRKEFWLEHIKAAEEFEGSIKEYCELHGLKQGSMSSYRTKLGFSKPLSKKSVKKENKFAPIKIIEPPRSTFPDPVWLVQFLKEWDRT